MTVVSFGGGVNSTALVLEMVRRGEPFDAAIFVDLQAERPAVYENIGRISEWLEQRGAPAITVLKSPPQTCGNDVAESLEQECMMRRSLPGLAYGYRSCSVKWKVRPFYKYLDQIGASDATVCIGFDASEWHRAERNNYQNKRFPLIEWDIDRDECRKIIRNAGLPEPEKSSCFFCPATRLPEILSLRCKHPNLFSRAVAIERNAELVTVKGLGRRFSWEWAAEREENQLDLTLGIETPCSCLD